MAEARKSFYRNIIGDTKETINAIQRFIEKNTPGQNNSVAFEEEENPAGSVNRVINSVVDENIVNDINKIIRDL